MLDVRSAEYVIYYVKMVDFMKHIDLWNRFIEEIYNSFLDNKDKTISNEKKQAIIAFAYDSEVNSGGYITFFDTFGKIFSIDKVSEALELIGGEKFASNFLSAASHIRYNNDLGYIDTNEDTDSDPIEDFVYYEMKPALPDLLEIYIFDNKGKIFN